jgi:hypothetical protein
MSSKIIVKKPTTSAVPKASAVVTAPSKVVVKAPAKVVAAPSKVVIKAPTKKATPAPKVVYQEEAEAEDSGSEAQPATAQEIYERIQELLGELVGLSGGRGKIKLTKTGKIRKPRGPRENSEKQSAWMDFVKQVREEQGVDENGKFLISHKDAMKLAKEMRAEAGEEAGSDHTEEAEEAPVPAKKVVTPNGKPKKAAAAAPAPAKRSPQEIREEFLAKQKAAAAAAQEEEQQAEVEVEEFEHDGKTYLKNSDNLCWLVVSEGEQTWAGVYLPEEDRIDDSVEEPTA